MEQQDKNDGCKQSEKCMEILHLLLDNEATLEQEVYLRDHLDKCLPCLNNFEIEQEIRTLLRTKIEKRAVPSDLLASIKDKINTSFAS